MNQSTVLYLDFVRDVEDVTEFLKQDGAKIRQYAGKMSVEDQKQAEKKFLQGEITVLVATESYELGVDNPNISHVIWIGCPCNLGVLLQEVGHAGRKSDSVANGLLLFYECTDDKCLGWWLKTALDATYVKTWHFIYSVYHGKCLSWALSHFYTGANDVDPCTHLFCW